MMAQVLADPAMEMVRRQQAAARLVGLGDTQAQQWLAGRLNTDQDPTTLRLILRALLSSDKTPAGACAQPLWALLEHGDEFVRYHAALVLGRYQQPDMIKRLITAAEDDKAAVPIRVGAITALSSHTGQEVVAVLIERIDPRQPSAIQQAAMAALTQLTGIRGNTHDQWLQWWKQHRKLPQEQWHRSLLTSLSQQNTRLAVESRYMSDQLIDLQRQLYRTTPQPDRPDLLIKMLADPYDLIRRLAVELCEQRLIDNQPIAEPLRAALLRRLEDPLAGSRRRVALLMRDLADENAADAVAALVDSGSEQDTEVLRAYLQLLARLPRASAVPHALVWLGNADRGLTIEAAGALAAAAKQGMLGADQAKDSAKWARKLVRDQPTPDPALIELLGRVGGDDDWVWIGQLLSSGADAVKRVAAEAWADSHQPLGVLMQHAADPVILPVAIAAARRRGFEPETFDALIAHKPEQEQVAQSWRLAIEAVAGRVPPAVVVDADRRLGQLGEPAGWRAQVLSAAIDRMDAGQGRAHNGTTNGSSQQPAEGQDTAKQPTQAEVSVLIDLLLARASQRVAGGELGQAQADYQWLSDLNPFMSPTQRGQRDLGLLRMRLTTATNDDVEQALALAQRLLGTGGDDTGVAVAPVMQAKVLDAFLSSTDRLSSTGQVELARSMLGRLAVLIGSALPGELETRLAELDQQIDLKAGKNPAGKRGNTDEPTGSTPPPRTPTISEPGGDQQPQP